ncbi:MAG TPA: hypothetical protein VK789_22550 [Bryobacteraceae bacterium]|nr:hypothetical protein [Bryobacteraceae bacterium]
MKFPGCVKWSLGVLTFVCLAPAVVMGQSGPANTVAADTGWKGDLTGVWQGPYTADLTRGTQAKLTPWGEEQFKRFDGTTDPCLPVGVTRQINAPDPIEIVQTPNRVVILYESWHIFRSIPTDGRDHPKKVSLNWFGNSVGKWDGDTLVIDVTGMNDKTFLDTNGHPHSDQLHLIEKFRRTGPETMSYEVTVDDPKVYVAPWTQSRVLRLQKGLELMEYVCLENEKDREHLRGIKK